MHQRITKIKHEIFKEIAKEEGVPIKEVKFIYQCIIDCLIEDMDKNPGRPVNLLNFSKVKRVKDGRIDFIDNYRLKKFIKHYDSNK